MSDSITFSIMAKPTGSACNLRCSYCYYKSNVAVMADDVLEAYIKQNIEAQGKDAVVEFAWHGGEPTLCGLDFFKRIITLQRKYGVQKMRNTLQTNGILLDDKWCAFFKENNFLIGISVDGPRHLHDANRKYRDGRASYDDTMSGLLFLRKWGVEYNTLTTVNPSNVKYPRETYQFLSKESDFIQFLPVVNGVQEAAGISAEDWGTFLCSVFDVWRNRDIGKKFVQIFEAAIGNMMERPPGFCVHEPVCGHCASVETDGNVYSCDWFSDQDNCIGNILKTPLKDIMRRNKNFGMKKAETLSQLCLDCPYLGLCWGGCPKHRVNGQNLLCSGYKKFFAHIQRTVKIAKAL